MEGVGARLGRSSTRYGPATVFTGPVRKWKKKWIHVPPSTPASNNHSHSQRHTNPSNLATNGTANATTSNTSHLLLYKWAPITQSLNNGGNNDDKNPTKEESPTLTEEPPRRKFKYIPIAVLEEQKNEAAENEAADKLEDEANKSNDVEPGSALASTKSELQDEKPDINDLPMEESESQDDDLAVRQDLNESTLDLSLNLNALNDDGEVGSKADHIRDGRRKG